MYDKVPHGAWVGRRLTPESGKDFNDLRHRIRSHLRMDARGYFRLESRRDVPYVNVPELHVLHALPNSNLHDSHRAIAQHVFRSMQAEADSKLADTLTSHSYSISTPELHRRYYVGFTLDSSELNKELRLADAALSRLGGIALRRDYNQRFIPLLSTGLRSVANHAAHGLQQQLQSRSRPLEFTFEPVSLDDNHVVDQQGFVDNALISSLVLPQR